MVCKCGEKLEEAGQANWNRAKLYGCSSCGRLWEEDKKGRRESQVKFNTWKKYKERA